MSAMPARLSFIQQHYEKIILVVMLLGLLVSAGLLVHRTSSGMTALRESSGPVTPGPDQAFAPLDFAPFTNSLRQMAQPWQTPDRTNRMFISELRVYDPKCLKWIPWNATNCPFCGAVQQGIGDEKDVDSDVDDMPDIFEQKYGFDPYNRDDARLDRDGDGFTNAEECKAGTDPLDAKSSPPIFAKLRLRRIQATTFQLRFLSVQKLSETDLRFQLNTRTSSMSHFKKIGDVVEGYTLDSYDKATDTLVLKRGATVKRLGRGKFVSDDQLVISFVFLLDGREFACRVGEIFTLRDQRAQVVELSADRMGVRIRLIEGGREYLVPRMTTDDETELQLRTRPDLGMDATLPMPVPPVGVPAPPTVAPTPAPPVVPGGGGLR